MYPRPEPNSDQEKPAFSLGKLQQTEMRVGLGEFGANGEPNGEKAVVLASGGFAALTRNEGLLRRSNVVGLSTEPLQLLQTHSGPPSNTTDQ